MQDFDLLENEHLRSHFFQDQIIEDIARLYQRESVRILAAIKVAETQASKLLNGPHNLIESEDGSTTNRRFMHEIRDILNDLNVSLTEICYYPEAAARFMTGPFKDVLCEYQTYLLENDRKQNIMPLERKKPVAAVDYRRSALPGESDSLDAFMANMFLKHPKPANKPAEPRREGKKAFMGVGFNL